MKEIAKYVPASPTLQKIIKYLTSSRTYAFAKKPGQNGPLKTRETLYSF
jgi:hypothetical protein